MSAAPLTSRRGEAWPVPAPGAADLTLTLTKPQLLGLLAATAWKASTPRATLSLCSGCWACWITRTPDSRSSLRDGPGIGMAALAGEIGQVRDMLVAVADHDGAPDYHRTVQEAVHFLSAFSEDRVERQL